MKKSMKVKLEVAEPARRFTCRTISKELLKLFPQFSKIEFVAGNGYFYFGDIDLKSGEPNYLNIASIYVCRLNHMALEKWVSYAASNLRDAIGAQ